MQPDSLPDIFKPKDSLSLSNHKNDDLCVTQDYLCKAISSTLAQTQVTFQCKFRPDTAQIKTV